MVINNISQILNLLNFQDPDKFYFIQIIQRRKDIPGLHIDAVQIISYSISSKESLLSIFEREIKPICNLMNARAYIHLNRRSFKDLAFEVNELNATLLKRGQFQKLKDSYKSVCGKKSSEEKVHKTYLIDFDEFKDPMELIELEETLKTLRPVGDKVIERIKTVSGVHLLCKPFDVQEFNKIYPKIDVKRDSPTLLYAKNDSKDSFATR